MPVIGIGVGIGFTQVAAGPATHFIVTGPGSSAEGDSFFITVTAYDANGLVAIGYHGTVTFTSSDLSALLPGDSTLTNGTGVFSVTLYEGGSQTVTATDTVTGSITGSVVISNTEVIWNSTTVKWDSTTVIWS